MIRQQVFASFFALFITVASTSTFCVNTYGFQNVTLDPLEQQVVALVNGSRAYAYDLEILLLHVQIFVLLAQ